MHTGFRVGAAAAVRLAAHDVHFRLEAREILNGVDLSIGAGEIVSLLGVNGAGKTTLLRLMLGLLKPTAGEVRLDDVAIAAIPRRSVAKALGYVPQVHTVPFPYTVQQVVSMGRLAQRGLLSNPSARDLEVVGQKLEQLRISHLAHRAYSEISGGERQLALIARALAQEARILILDEPMANLDLGYQGALCRHLRELAADGHAILMSCHDPQLAYQTSTRIAILADGRLERDGVPEQVMTAETMRQLYGVSVEAVSLSGSRRAFFFR